MAVKNKWFASITSVVLSIGVLVGCGTNTGQNPPEQSQPKQSQPAKAPQATTYPLTIKDATGTEITIPAEPKRIVSLLPSDTEILFALGLGDKVVGVSKWADYPAEAKTKPIIGDMNIDTEKVIAQKPDLVIGGATATKQGIEALRKLGVTVYAMEPTTMEEVESSIKEVGRMTNTNVKADEVVAGMEAKVAAVKAKLQRVQADKMPTVFVEVSPAPDIYTAGKGTFMDELVSLAGGKNIFADITGWKKISAEQVIAKNPAIILSTHGVTADVQKGVSARAGWGQIDAVKNKRIVAVDTNLVSRPGPRLVNGLELFAKAIHPELFAK